MTATNWQVITGAPCSGKTAVIDFLSSQGLPTVPEAARRYMDICLARGLAIEQVKADIRAFETAILQQKLQTENRLDPDKLVFMDRALPDSIAYFELEGLDTEQVLRACGRFRYQRIFLFQRLPLRRDQVRLEDEATAARLEKLLIKAYRQLGYRPLKVPAMGIEARAALILSHCLKTSDQP